MKSAVHVLMLVFTLGNILACLWLIWWTAKRRVAVEAEKTGHVWDEIEEYNNPMPRWWLGLFIITIVFSLVYLALYPGLGWFAGTTQWTAVDQLKAEQASAQAALEARFADVVDKDLVTLSRDVPAMATARNLFANNCSTCHGADARGAKGFPNLADTDWLWGGDPQTIYQTISNGRKGAMPGWGTALGQQGVEEVAAYVVHLSGRKAPEDWVRAGKARFETLCAACHGADGKGLQTVGAPNLTDSTWVYGGSFAAVRESVTNGRNNEMPAHHEMLGDLKVRLLAAYVYGLSKRDAGQQVAHATP